MSIVLIFKRNYIGNRDFDKRKGFVILRGPRRARNGSVEGPGRGLVKALWPSVRFAGVYKEPRVCDPVREGLGSFYSAEKVWDCVPGRGLLGK